MRGEFSLTSDEVHWAPESGNIVQSLVAEMEEAARRVPAAAQPSRLLRIGDRIEACWCDDRAQCYSGILIGVNSNGTCIANCDDGSRWTHVPAELIRRSEGRRRSERVEKVEKVRECRDG